MMDSTTQYVIYIEHDNRQSDVRVFATREQAEQWALGFARDVFEDGVGSDDDTVFERLCAYNEYLRLYKVAGDTSRELIVRSFA
jgi:hypothetical protein